MNGVSRQLEEALAAHQQGRLAEAERGYRDVLRQAPDDAGALHLLGLIVAGRGAAEEAEGLLRRAVERRPAYFEAHNSLGNFLLDAGRSAEAEVCLRRALALAPEFALAHYNLGRLLQQNSRGGQALAAYQRALELEPRLAPAAYNRGAQLYELGELDRAIEAYRDLLSWDGAHAHAWNNLGKALRERGEAAAAVASFERAAELAPGDAEIASNRLFALQHVDDRSAEDLLAEHRRYAARFAPDAACEQWGVRFEPERRLRVGLVSADLRRHAMANFLEPVLEHHDRSRYELICFSNAPGEDEETARLRAWADGWHSLVGLDDAAAAARIVSLGIDLLLDLSGHSAGNRLGVFARRPAPLQLTWLGYIGSTGLTAIDYRISDAVADPPGLAEGWHSEALARMPHAQWCYRPSPEAPPPAPRRGSLCFGSFNNLAKLSDACLDLWGEALAGIEGARLLVAAAPEGEARSRIVDRLGARGVAASRLEFRGRLPPADYLALYAEVDIALDSYPYTGGTTTCDALWMGVPVLSLAGRRSAARSAASLLQSLGLADWVASSPQEFCAIAGKWADKAADLASLRLGLRARMKKSALMQERAFVRDWESLLRSAWRKSCQGAATG